MIDEETLKRLREILDENKDETAGKLGVILTEVALYIFENYEITTEQLKTSFNNSIDIINKYIGEEDGE